ncbi:hypothetical protein [Rathayibacter sp. VKM Ac-2801]|nr:hypothetical protein [Rathayibacter sp. VKM Ac-2801]
MSAADVRQAVTGGVELDLTEAHSHGVDTDAEVRGEHLGLL